MVKKLAVGLLVAVLMLYPFCVSAAQLYAAEITQVLAVLPQVEVYFRILDTNDTPAGLALQKEDVKLSLNGTALQLQELSTFGESGEGTAYYFLLDVSASMPKALLSNMKQSILQKCESAAEKDKVVVIAFGEKVNVVLDGNESLQQAEMALQSLYAADKETHLYDAMVKTAQLVADERVNSDRRPVVVLVTDGLDEMTAGSSSAEAVNEMREAGAPIYALTSGGSDAALNTLGELARATGGNIMPILPSQVSAALTQLDQQLQSEYRAVCAAESNDIGNGRASVTVTIKTEAAEYSSSRDVALTDWLPDNEAPAVLQAEITEPNVLKLVFSEAVLGADQLSAYRLSRGSKQIPIEAVSYDAASRTATLCTGQKIYAGSYTLAVSAITDASLERNAADTLFRFESESVPRDAAYYFSTYYYFLFILLLIPAAVLGGAAMKKHKAQAGVGQQTKPTSAALPGANAHISLPQVNGAELSVTVIDASGLQRQVECFVSGLYVIGRDAATCDLAIADKRLSRQHCALAYDNGQLTIQDLQSTNGTAVNGIAISKPRLLCEGDVVVIANTKLVVRSLRIHNFS